MEWLDRNCPNVPFLFNADSDIFAHTENIVEFLKSRHDADGSRHLLAGEFNLNVPIVRNRQSRYYVPYEIQKSDVSIPFLTGFGVLLSRYTASAMYNVSQFVPLQPMEDNYMAMCAAKAGLELMSHGGIKYFPGSKPDPCLYKDMLVVHKVFPKELYILWNQVHDRKLKCVSRK